MALIPKIKLSKFKWISTDKCNVTGFAWYKGDYFEGEDFAILIHKNSESFENFKNTATLLNGQFSIVIVGTHEVWAVCSQIWSYPLFYQILNSELVLADDPGKIIDEQKVSLFDPFSELYFYVFGVTPTHFTLVKDLFQVRPGEIVKFCENKIEKHSIRIKPDSHRNQSVSLADPENLHQLLMNVFERHFNEIKNRKVLLPLTRGYDSRLLACLLKVFGHNNVICSTWGRANNIELATAKKVADQLGFSHIFVDYSKVVKKGFVTDELFKDYIRYTGHLSSMPYLQDYFAVKKLKEDGLIDNQTVVLPGHPGDFLRGSHLESDFNSLSTDKLTSRIISKFGSSLPVSGKAKKSIQNVIAENFFADELQSNLKGFEHWDLEERQCKFVGNSVSVFSFFGMESRMPLFDNEALQFFENLSFEQKMGAVFYNSTLEKCFFHSNKVDFDLKPVNNIKPALSEIKEVLVKLTPSVLKKWYYPVNDTIFYREITEELINSDGSSRFKSPNKPHFYNSYIIQWYLNFIKSNH
jgi:asparagine synthase (glutamine-hydrolysing)